MNLKLQYNCSNINWNYVPQILKKVGMALFHNTERMEVKGFTE